MNVDAGMIAACVSGGLLAGATLLRRALRQQRAPSLAQSSQEILGRIAEAIKTLNEIELPAVRRELRELQLAIGDRARVQEEHDATLQTHGAKISDLTRRMMRVERRLDALDLDEEGHLG